MSGKISRERGRPPNPLERAKKFVDATKRRPTLADGEALKTAKHLRALRAFEVPESDAAMTREKHWALLSLESILKRHAYAAEEWLGFLDWARRHNDGETPRGERLRELRADYVALQEMQNRP